VTFSRLIVSRSLLAEVIAHALAEAPLECCGLLAGHLADGAGLVTARYGITNVARSATEYETEPRDMLCAFRAMRANGTELLAIYHSHPTSAPVPSQRDVERNTYGTTAVHLIVSLASKEPEVRAWWLTETDFREAHLVIAAI
jgi:proteasome lid subunit RPN8/RPN11